METIVISDTNIFIDLINVDLLEQFFHLPWKIVTTEPILLELKYEGQHDTVKAYSDLGSLQVATFSGIEVTEILHLKRKHESHSNLSLQDCSVWYCARKYGGKILSGDGQLRKYARLDGLEVRGIIYVIDCMVEVGLLEQPEAAERLKQLRASNPRLPMEEIDKRIERWGKEQP